MCPGIRVFSAILTIWQTVTYGENPHCGETNKQKNEVTDGRKTELTNDRYRSYNTVVSAKFNKAILFSQLAS